LNFFTILIIACVIAGIIVLLEIIVKLYRKAKSKDSEKMFTELLTPRICGLDDIIEKIDLFIVSLDGRQYIDFQKDIELLQELQKRLRDCKKRIQYFGRNEHSEDEFVRCLNLLSESLKVVEEEVKGLQKLFSNPKKRAKFFGDNGKIQQICSLLNQHITAIAANTKKLRRIKSQNAHL